MTVKNDHGRAGPARGRRKGRAALLAFVLSAALTGCGGGPPPETFDLAALPPGAGAGRLRGQLIVSEPVATQALDSDRILVRPSPESVAYLTGAQWSDRLPKLIQTRLVQSLENARLLQSVGRPGDRITADYLLDAELRRFEIETTGGEAVVEITVKLIAANTGRIVAGDVVTARAPGSAGSGQAAAQSLDAALAVAMRRIVTWVGQRI